jgi:hypothetical protein
MNLAVDKLRCNIGALVMSAAQEHAPIRIRMANVRRCRAIG